MINDPEIDLKKGKKRCEAFAKRLLTIRLSSISATYRAKLDCPIGYVICKNDNFDSDLTLFDRKMTFNEAKLHCKDLNSTICKY